MLKAVFYARFHPERGPSVIHQHPPASILSTHSSPLVNWSDITSYIIPPYDLCNQALSICAGGYRILAFPVSLEDARYDRNRFTFTICLVLPEHAQAQPWEPIARKTAKFLVALEEEDGLLQTEEDLRGLKWAGEEGYPAQDVGILHCLLSDMYENLNTYGETCIRINHHHVLNLRLQPAMPVPPTVRIRHVPLLIRSLPNHGEWTWGLTLRRIHPHMDGIRHVQRIAELADVEVKLVKSAVCELVRHGYAMLLDIFHFQAIYACTEGVTVLISDEQLQAECQRYVAVDLPPDTVPSAGAASEHVPVPAPAFSPTRQDLIELYCLLQPGLQLSEFCLTYKSRLCNVDIRRFITFGVINRFVRRLHKYALAIGPYLPSSSISKQTSGPLASKPKSNEDVVKEFDRVWRKAALSSGWITPLSAPLSARLAKSYKSAEMLRIEEDEKLRGYLDGEHCMDSICVAMQLSEKKIIERLRSGRLGEVVWCNK